MASPMPWSPSCTLPHVSPALSAIRTWLTKMSFENTNNSALISYFGMNTFHSSHEIPASVNPKLAHSRPNHVNTWAVP
jgi:hypothetical protein